MQRRVNSNRCGMGCAAQPAGHGKLDAMAARRNHVMDCRRFCNLESFKSQQRRTTTARSGTMLHQFVTKCMSWVRGGAQRKNSATMISFVIVAPCMMLSGATLKPQD